LARWRHKLKAPQENVVPSEEQLTKKAFGLFSTPLDRGGIMAEMKNSKFIFLAGPCLSVTTIVTAKKLLICDNAND
jgi:hypothetical protein